jgi:ankyrin repeat protein
MELTPSLMFRTHFISRLAIIFVACVLVGHSRPCAGGEKERSRQGLLDTIRAGHTAGVQRLLRQGVDVNDCTEDGTTALMLATVVGDLRLVQTLLDHGAKVNAKNQAGATAILWAVGDVAKAKALLARGADVNARADSGRTPLLIAAGSARAAEVVKLLCDHGADVRYGQQGYTVLMAAVEGGDREVVRFLLAKGADTKAKNRAGWTALHAAAMARDRRIAEDLLAHGAEVNAADTIQGRTPLHWATVGGRADLVRLFLDRGADVRVRESLGGTTTLICAAASERGDLTLVNLLLEKGAALEAKDASGASALDWAQRRGSRPIVQALGRRGARRRAVTEPQAPRRPMGDDNTVDKAVAAALPLLQQTSATFLTKSGSSCISCHHQSLPALALQLSRTHGFQVDEKQAKLQAETTQRQLAGRRERLLQGAGVADQLDACYWLLGLAAADVPRNGTTDALVHYLTLKQAKDGHWQTTLFRPPANDSDFTATALAVRGLQHFGPPGRVEEIAGRIAKARQWLLAAAPQTTEDRTFHLFGLKWAESRKQDIAKAAVGLLAEQRKDGGWGQLAPMPSDPYATGQSIVALQQAGGLSVSDPAYRRGVQFLLKTQLQDGSWFVESRSLPVQPYFESGFPHGRSQFMSCFATSWATMALALGAERLPR